MQLRLQVQVQGVLVAGSVDSLGVDSVVGLVAEVGVALVAVAEAVLASVAQSRLWALACLLWLVRVQVVVVVVVAAAAAAIALVGQAAEPLGAAALVIVAASALVRSLGSYGSVVVSYSVAGLSSRQRRPLSLLSLSPWRSSGRTRWPDAPAPGARSSCR